MTPDAAAAAAIPPDLLIVNIGQLCTVHDPVVDAAGPRRGPDLARIGAVAGAALAVRDGRVLACGPEAAVVAQTCGRDGPGRATTVVDAGGRAVTPGWVDPHTHAVFGRTRQDEYERRLRGETYLQIAAAGGGIRASVRDLRERDHDDLLELACARLSRLLDDGTTTVEIKSGYGLSPASEVKMLEVAREAARLVGVRAVLTCLAAHEVPDEYRDRRGEYIDQVCDEVLPRVAGDGLAERCDVFCEPSVFGLAESERILQRARDLGLRLCVHADELEPMGGAVLAARLGADSADHLIAIDAAGIAALAASRTVATLLPGTVFTLGLRHYAPARAMIDAGCAVALASDFNPGSCPIGSVPLIQSIACSQMRLLPSEALVGCTLNAAWALGLADEVGSLAPGKAADFLLLTGDDHRLVPYHGGGHAVAQVYVGGRRVR
ncbi:MAG: imidazolonepropionase [Candidatus Krumholzibacteriia bacterium]